MPRLLFCTLSCALAVLMPARAQDAARTVDLPTREGVTQRLLLQQVPRARATVLLFAGGHGGLQIFQNGSMRWGDGNFLVRSRQLFVDQGLTVAVIDSPSDLQRPPFLAKMRQTPAHVADVKATIAWLRANGQSPVWLVGTSRGTQSVAHVATELHGAEGPDGIVLTSSILHDDETRALPEMPLARIRVPTLVVHHANDGCRVCPPAAAPALVEALVNAPRRALISMQGGTDRGNPCGSEGHHGFNGLEADVVQRMAAWMAQP